MATLITLWVTARRLWLTVPRWRWMTIAAALCAVGSLFAGAAGTNTPTQGSNQAAPPQPIPPNQATPTTQRPPGRVNPGAPINHQAQQRLADFYRAYQTSTNSAAGARCDDRVAALAKLSSGDEATASRAQKDAIAETRNTCSDAIKESNARLLATKGAWEAFKAKPTAGTAREVIENADRFTAFDRERNLRAKGIQVSEIDTLRTDLARYGSGMDRATTTEALYRAGDPATLGAAVSLAAILKELEGLPFPVETPGMPAREANAVEAMKDARRALAEADHRSQVLRNALGSAQADPQGLAIALAALTPLDRARAQASGVDLQAARAVARDALPLAVDPVAKRYAAAPTRADADTLAGLSGLAKDLGARLEPATAETVRTAERHIADSGQRLAELRRTAHDWVASRARGKPDKPLEERVKSVYRIVTGSTGQLYPFDRAAATPADDEALRTIGSAMLEIEGRLIAGTSRQSVAIQIDTSRLSNTDVVARALPAALGKQLAAAGFTVVANARDAVLSLVLSDSSVRSLAMDANGRFQRQVEIHAEAAWRFSGKSLRLGDVEGDGADRDPARALDQAIEATATNIVRSLGAVISQ